MLVRLAETTQTLYAELLDQLRSAQTVPPSGSFVSKIIGGRTYWYAQRVDAGRKRQVYVGAETPELLANIAQASELRSAAAEDERRRRELVTMLRAAGMASEPEPTASVLRVIAETGMFRVGAVLVGTQALGCLANMLGVRFDLQMLRTADVDLACPPVRVAVGPIETDLLHELRGADERFFPVPELDARQPSTSFKVRGRDLRVDLLTPASRDGRRPVLLPHLNAAATPLRGLRYLMSGAVEAAVLVRGGLLVNVPSPGRFALHKLWVAGRRPISQQAKARKDIRQASHVIEVLASDRPDELADAWTALDPAMRRGVARSARALEPDVRECLANAIGGE